MNDKALSQGQNERIQEAEKNLRRIQERIAPFVRHRKAKMYSTAGRWCATPNWLELCGEDDRSQLDAPSC